MSLLVSGGTVVTSLDPPAVSAVRRARGRRAHRGGGRRGQDAGRRAHRCLGMPRHPRQRQRPHAPLLGARAGHALPTRAARATSSRSSSACGGVSTGPSTRRSVRASALVGGLEALLAGTTTLIDHHASPNAIDGSLDVVAEALASLGLRSVCCYEVTDRDGPERSQAGLAENAPLHPPHGRRRAAPGARHGRRARLLHAVRRDPGGLCRSGHRDRRTASTSTPPRTPRTRPIGQRRHGAARGRAAWPTPARSTTGLCSPTASTSTRTRRGSSATSGRPLPTTRAPT